MPKVTKKNVSSKKKQGKGYIVISYSPYYGSWVVSHNMSYRSACYAVKMDRQTWNTEVQDYVCL